MCCLHASPQRTSTLALQHLLTATHPRLVLTPVLTCRDTQAASLDQALSGTGGLASYVTRARGLLADSKNGVNPYDGYTPSVPQARCFTAPHSSSEL